MKTKLICLILSNFLIFISCNKDEEISIGQPELIEKNSELFDLIKMTTTNVNLGDVNPIEEIVCIDFIYPIGIISYNSDFEPVELISILSDEQFVNVLDNLPNNYLLSISYPINLLSENGNNISINNNEDLKNAIQSCSREDIISYCENIFSNQGVNCSWYLPYTDLAENNFLSGRFFVNQNNIITFKKGNETLIGSWFFLYLNNKLNININLLGNSPLALSWNFNREVEVSENRIVIKYGLKDIHLYRICETNDDFILGDTGPGGGIVFYDKGFYENGWRYMEVNTTQIVNIDWGCVNSEIVNSRFSSIGMGYSNSASIYQYHQNLNNYFLNPSICSPINNGTVAAKNAIELTNNIYRDWFLPSIDEVELIYTNLHLSQITIFDEVKYWSSTEKNNSEVYILNFSNGEKELHPKNYSNNTKSLCVRYF